MDTPAPTLNDVLNAALAGDFSLTRQLASQVDLNRPLENQNGLLADLIWLMSVAPESTFKSEMVNLLLELGADPNWLDNDGVSALTQAMFEMDAEMTLLLLQHGADPNLPSGHGSEDTFYDWALFDYMHNAYLIPSGTLSPPEEPLEADLQSEDAWLEFLDRCAEKYGVKRPIHLRHLRAFGAKTSRELTSTKNER